MDLQGHVSVDARPLFPQTLRARFRSQRTAGARPPSQGPWAPWDGGGGRSLRGRASPRRRRGGSITVPERCHRRAALRRQAEGNEEGIWTSYSTCSRTFAAEDAAPPLPLGDDAALRDSPLVARLAEAGFSTAIPGPSDCSALNSARPWPTPARSTVYFRLTPTSSTAIPRLLLFLGNRASSGRAASDSLGNGLDGRNSTER